MFGTSDYMDRAPYRKLTVGLSHAWLGGFLALFLPVWLVLVGYVAKEVAFDLARVWVDGRSKLLHHMWRDWRLIADSAVDLAFTALGALMVDTLDWRYGIGALAVGAAYFAFLRATDDRSN